MTKTGSTGRRRTVAVAVALIGMLALGLSGCMKMDTSMVISEDDTYTATVIMAFDEEMVAEVGASTGQTNAEVMEQFRKQLGEDALPEGLEDGATVEDYDEGGWVGWRISDPSPLPLSQLSSNSQDGVVVNIEREGNEYLLTGELDFTAAAMEIDEADLKDPQVQTALDQMEVTLAFTFPGKVTSGNGEISGNTVTYSAVIGQVVEISAVAGAGGKAPAPSKEAKPSKKASGSPKAGSAESADDEGKSAFGAPWLWGGLGAVIVIAAAVITIVLLRVKKGEDAGQPPGLGYPPEGYGPLPGAPGSGPSYQAGPMGGEASLAAPGEAYPGGPPPVDPTQQWPQPAPPPMDAAQPLPPATPAAYAAPPPAPQTEPLPRGPLPPDATQPLPPATPPDQWQPPTQ
ncbi:MAG: hypothetical protein LBJ02_04990 [Bifidobacteriaceae bacterium]|nr:hypothetical protein [Bifidobacteriaceae bacterium]